MSQNYPSCVSMGLVFSCTIAADLFFLTLQVLGAVCFEGGESAKLSEVTQKGLLLLLRMCCQNLLGQAQLLVALSLLTGRWKCTRRSRKVLAGFGHFPCAWYVLYDLCMNDSKRITLISCKATEGGVFNATQHFIIKSDKDKSNIEKTMQ